MGLREEIKEYLQPDGLLSPKRNPTPDSTGNGQLYLALYYILLSRLGLLVPYDTVQFSRTMKETLISDSDGWPIPGLYNRSRTKLNDQNSWDNYIGIAVAGKYLQTLTPRSIVVRGRRSRYLIFRWFYNNISPDKFSWGSWFGRNPATPAIFLYANDQIPNFFRRAWLAASILWSAIRYAKDASNVIQTWLALDAVDSRGFLPTLAGAVWGFRVRRAWGVQTESEVMRLALGEELGYNHPIKEYWA